MSQENTEPPAIAASAGPTCWAAIARLEQLSKMFSGHSASTYERGYFDGIRAAIKIISQSGDPDPTIVSSLWSLVGEWNARKSDIRSEAAVIELEAAIGDLEDLLQRM